MKALSHLAITRAFMIPINVVCAVLHTVLKAQPTSSLKTATLNYINSTRQKGEEPDHADVTASYTRVIVDAIVKKTEEALKRTGSRQLVLAGGVAANSHIRGALETLCEKRGVAFCKPSLSLCSDNAAMVAAAGYYEYLRGNFADTSLNGSCLD